MLVVGTIASLIFGAYGQYRGYSFKQFFMAEIVVIISGLSLWGLGEIICLLQSIKNKL